MGWSILRTILIFNGGILYAVHTSSIMVWYIVMLNFSIVLNAMHSIKESIEKLILLCVCLIGSEGHRLLAYPTLQLCNYCTGS